MPDKTLTFPFVDLRSRLSPEHLDLRARSNSRPATITRARPLIEEIAAWLCRAQDAAGDGSLPAYYHLQTGWSAVSAEMTGSAICTMLSLADVLPEYHPLDRAVRLGKALARTGRTEIQVRSGHIPQCVWAIPGWIALYERTAKSIFRQAAVNAGKCLMQRCTAHTLEQTTTLPQRAMLSAALGRLWRLQPKKPFGLTADFLGMSIMRHCAPNGFLRDCVGANGADPPLVYLAGTYYGLLESGIMSRNRSWMVAAQCGAQRLLELHRQKGTLAGRYGPDWRADHSFSCMAGCAQTAWLWLRLYQLGFADEYYHAASQLTRFVASTVDSTHPDPGIRGGIRAGYPLWIDYHPLTYSTQAAVQALDAFLLEKKLAGHRPVHKLHLRRPAESGSPEGAQI
jgi:hypothetical protein